MEMGDDSRRAQYGSSQGMKNHMQPIPHYLHFFNSVIPTPCLVKKKDFFFLFLAF
jgi:hypothetical protein